MVESPATTSPLTARNTTSIAATQRFNMHTTLIRAETVRQRAHGVKITVGATINLALGQPTASSALWSAETASSNANDGDRDHSYPNLFHSDGPDNFAWWAVKLDSVVTDPMGFEGDPKGFLAEAFASLKTAVLQLDPGLTESARVLGAPNWKRILFVQFPAVKPGIAAAFVICALAITKELPATLLLSGPMGLRPLSVRIFDRYEDAFLADAGLAGALLTGLALAIALLTLRWRRYA